MSASSFHGKQPPRDHRPHSHLAKSPPAGLRDGTEIYNFPSSHFSSSRSSSRPGVPEKDANAATGPSRSSALSNSNDRRQYMTQLVDRVPQSVRGQPLQMPRPQGLVTEQPTYLSTSSRQSLRAQDLTRSSSQRLPQLYQNQGILSQAHDFAIMGSTFHSVNIATSNQFMKDFLNETIPGAASESSARHPPPRCHPGTRLAILERCLYFIANCNGPQKIRWVVGAAGVGKSAIMQSVTEYPDLPVVSHASVFFSAVGSNDGSKAILTLSYQFAAKSEPYRQLVEDKISRDPSILQSSVVVQFNKLIVEPFIHHPQLNSAGRFLIILDGLDECSDPHTQQELLRLISDFCIHYPTSPIVWLIASRPESHITSFFSRRNVIPAYEKEEIPVDSTAGRADVGLYLRHELMEIKEGSDSLDPGWPEEQDVRKLANAAGGLFAYAHAVVRYIKDSNIGSPAAQLADVLNVIDNHPMPNVPREEHPMALLDALYARILSNVPIKVMPNTRKLLLSLVTHRVQYLWCDGVADLILLCNWLGMTPDEAYAALNHLRSILRVPKRDKAYEGMPVPFHKSLIDYISDYRRSGFSHDIELEAQQIKTKCAFRTLEEACDGIDFGGAVGYGVFYGTLARGPGTGDKISLTWLANGKGGWNDDGTRLNMYKLAIAEVASGMKRRDPTFESGPCIRLLTTRFQDYAPAFPYCELRDLVFAESRRAEFMMCGLLKLMRLNEINTSNVFYGVKLQFHRLHTTVRNLPDPWDSSCTHEREGEWREGKDQNWKTTFLLKKCHCFDRFRRQLKQIQSLGLPGYSVPILLTSTGRVCVEFLFVDTMEDGMSEWTYWFWYELTGKERIEGSRTIL